MTTNLTTKREEILKEFETKYSKAISGLAIGPKQNGRYWSSSSLQSFLDQSLKSYGEEVAKQTREKVIEEIQKHIHEQATESQTDVNIEFDLYLDQLRSTQPKEEGNIQRLPDTLIKGKHTGSTVAVKTFSIKLTDKDKP